MHVPFLVQIIKLDKEATVVEQILTPHQLRHIGGFIDNAHLITWGIDGVVAVYNPNNNHELLCCFAAGNRHSYGIKKAQCDPKRKFVIALDHNGNLISSDLNVKIGIEEQVKMNDALNKAEISVQEKFSTPTSGGFPDLNDQFQGAKKFIDMKCERAQKMEVEESEETRKLLFKKISKLREQIKILLDDNELTRKDERLEIKAFNLDLMSATFKEEEARKERDQQDKKMMEYIDAQTAMNNWIIEKCWNHLMIKGTKIRAMFDDLFVENFPLLPQKNEKEIKQIALLRAIENSVGRDDVFLAWRPIPTIDLEKILVKEPGMFELNSNDTAQYTKNVQSLMGTCTHRFLAISPLHYQQLDVVTFHQMNFESILIEVIILFELYLITFFKNNFRMSFLHSKKCLTQSSMQCTKQRTTGFIQFDLKTIDYVTYKVK